MEAPLLDTASAGDSEPIRSLGELKSVICLESVKVWKIAGPAVITILSQFGVYGINTMFVGHLGDIELASVSVSLNILGMGSALETLCGQAYGAGQVHMLGIYMQRSWIVLLVSCFFILPIYIFATPILKFFGQVDQIADLAGTFTLQTIPQLFSLAINFPCQKFLQAQSKVNVLASIAFSSLILHMAMLWLFIYQLGWGTTGAAVAFDISRWGIAVAEVVYIMVWCREAGWNGFSWLAFKDIWPFVRLSLASALMLCLEIWYTTAVYLISGHLDNPVIAVGALSICLNINNWQMMFFVGLNAAISVRVSNELGRGHPRAAKHAVYVTIFESLLIGILCMVIIFITRNKFSIIYTSDEALQRAVSHLAYLLGATMLLNSVQPVISGVAIGGGWQAMVAYINLGCYYIFGLPLGYLLSHVANLGVMGLWGGMICGLALQTIFLLFVLFKTNWNKEVEQSSERMRKWGDQFIKNDQKSNENS
ncbi:protein DETOXIFICATION 35-like isoform X2 [Ziziphus jujuba]|uniref:Protein DETOXIFICATION n=1 Tax=Ziziphus jujuba TaxID=326968 RepID=A0ABM3ICC5_ZIZJJ|nr:protein DETOXIFICATION 35-like isoform X2 [Ziziphus jujuba]